MKDPRVYLAHILERIEENTYRTAHPEVPWRSMAATRDVLIHDYPGVSLQQVWQIIEQDLPPLKTAIVTLLPPLDQLEAELAGDTDEQDENTATA